MIASIAIPYLKGALQTTFETAAIKNIQTLHTAQAQFFAGHRRYAASLAELGQPEQLVDGRHNSYLFRLEADSGGYAIYAAPEKPGKRAEANYYSDESQVIRSARGSAAGPTSSPIE